MFHASLVKHITGHGNLRKQKFEAASTPRPNKPLEAGDTVGVDQLVLRTLVLFHNREEVQNAPGYEQQRYSYAMLLDLYILVG